MDPFTGLLGALGLAGAAAGMSAGGSALDAAIQYHYAKKMYQHRYRWAVDDMKKAGLNPILAANGGSVAGMSSAPSTDFASAGNAGISAAINAAKAVSDINAQEVTNDKLKADEKLANANADLVASKKVAQDVTNMELPRQVRAQAFKAEAEASIANSASVMARARNQYAERIALYEANDRHIMSQKHKYDALNSFWDRTLKRHEYYSRWNPDAERHLRWRERLAKLSKTESSPWLSLLNSAVRLVK